VVAVELAVYADALAGEAATLAARIERSRSRLRLASIERAARCELDGRTIAALEELGLLRTDACAAHAELRAAEDALGALATLQAWVERRLAAAEADVSAA
jgi:hypothetical protein